MTNFKHPIAALLVLPLSFLICPAASAQGSSIQAEQPFGCKGYPRTNLDRSVTVCQLREFKSLPSSDSVKLRAHPPAGSGSGSSINIGTFDTYTTPPRQLRAQGENRTTVDLKAYVYATASDEAAANATAAEVVIHTADGDFYATRPQPSDPTAGIISIRGPNTPAWSASFAASVPHETDVTALGSSGNVQAQDLAGTVSLETISGDILANRISGTLRARANSGAIRVQDASGKLEISTISGKLDLLGLSGTVVASTNSGDVSAKELDGQQSFEVISGNMVFEQVRGRSDFRSNSGDLQVLALDGQSQFESISGDVKLQGVSGTLEGSTNSGNVVLDLAGPAWIGAGAALTTISGDVSFLIPANYSAVFEFETNSGTIRSDFSGKTYADDIVHQETLGRGGATLKTTTNSGDITLSKK